MTRCIRAFWPVVLWMGFVFYMSTDVGSATHTSRFLGPLVRWFVPDITLEGMQQIQFFVRKGAHVAEYAVLALLLLRSLRVLRDTPSSRWSWPLAFTSVLAAVAYAASDEFHQSFVPTRGGSVYDVGFDSVGALLGVVLAYLWWRGRQRYTAAYAVA